MCTILSEWGPHHRQSHWADRSLCSGWCQYAEVWLVCKEEKQHTPTFKHTYAQSHTEKETKIYAHGLRPLGKIYIKTSRVNRLWFLKLRITGHPLEQPTT